MADTVANILLKITGDTGDARREVELLAKDVQQFDTEEATATADVDTDPADRKLRDIFGDLARLAREKATAKVDADTSAATTGMKAVEARAELLDAKDVDIEVNIDTDRADRGVQGFVSKLGGLLRGAGKAQSALGDLSQAGFGAVTGSAGAASSATENLSGSVGTSGAALRIAGVAAAALAGIIAPILVAAIGSAVAALAALAASLTLALGAAGALALALGATLLPVFGLVALAAERFKRTSDIAGTAAAKLKTAFQDFAGAVRKAVAPGVGLVFEALATSLRILTPLVESLGPAFERLGGAVGGALVQLAKEFARPVWVEFFRRLIAMASEIIPPLTGLFVGLLRVLRNVVLVVLPFLPSLLDKAAGAMKNLARNGAGVETVLGFFGDALPHLREWWRLVKAVADIFLGFVKGAAPAGKELVGWLADGAEKIGEWVNSAKGQEEIKQFFEDVLPLVKQVVEFFGRLAILAITSFQGIAPALTGVFDVMNFFLGLLQKLVDAWNSLSAPLRSVLLPLGGLTGVLSNLSTAAGNVVPKVKELAAGIVDGLSGAVSGAVGVMRDVFDAVVAVIRARIELSRKAAEAVMGAVKAGFSAVAGAVRDVANAILDRVVDIVRGHIDRARAAGTAVFTAVRNGIASVAENVREAARSIIARVIEIVRSFVDNARSAGAAVFNAVRNGIASVADTVREAARSIISRVIDIVRSFIDNAESAGARIFIAVNNGIVSVADTIRANVRSIITRSIQIILDLADSFFNAGKAIVQALANGIAAGAGAALQKLKDLAGQLKSLLPGSEPKDPTSPLRGLGKAGEAIVQNLAAGIGNAGPLLAATLARAASGMSVQASGGVLVSGASAAPGLDGLASALAAAGSPGPAAGPVVHLSVPTVVPADSASLAMIADVVTEALSRQGYRGAKVEVVG